MNNAISILKKSFSIAATICVGTTSMSLDVKSEPYVDNSTMMTSITHPAFMSVYNIEKNINSTLFDDALSLFGEQRKYTDEERKTYLEATKRGAKKLDFNVLDYMRNR